MYFLNIKDTFPDSSNLFNLGDTYKDDKPISLNTFITRIIKDLVDWNIRIQVCNYTDNLYCIINKGVIYLNKLNDNKDLLINHITKIKGCVIDKTCTITIALDGNLAGIFTKLSDCIDIEHNIKNVQYIRSYIRQLPYVKYSFDLLEEMFLSDLEYYIDDIYMINTLRIDDCTFTLESINKDVLNSHSLRFSIDKVLSLPNYKDIFECNIKTINDKEVYCITFKIP